MSQKSKAMVHAYITLTGAAEATLRKVIANFPKSLKVANIEDAGADHVDLNVYREPVWGNWPEDIRRSLNRAIAKTDSSVTYRINTTHRTVVEERGKPIDHVAVVGAYPLASAVGLTAVVDEQVDDFADEIIADDSAAYPEDGHEPTATA